eukprot:TRINITY_DN14348_c0_g2_i1.p1 TRINITY_DN14348_c0_g2~~TRINITY_DN14348_c0_g2_i1.p1  ORF type:complete len:302 (-),score=30.40 TRINITY_DN14348_c0_g2_i1:22-927(-)
MELLFFSLSCGALLVSVVHLAFEILGQVTNAFPDAVDEWYTTTPSAGRAYVCKRARDGDCTEAWSPFESFCYRMFSSQEAFADAQEGCSLEGAFLASIHSDGENAHVQQLCSSLSPPVCYIGLTRPTASSENWEWADGSSFDYSKWGRESGGGAIFQPQTVATMGKWVRTSWSELLTTSVINVVVMAIVALLLAVAVRRKDASILSCSAVLSAVCGALCCVGTINIFVLMSMDYAHFVPKVIMGLSQVACLCTMVFFRFRYYREPFKVEIEEVAPTAVTLAAGGMRPQAIEAAVGHRAGRS